MKILSFLLVCAVFAGCGPKSNEEIVKELITAKMKSSLPDFSKYESVNFGTMETAFLPYEETNQSVANIKDINACKDSVAVLEKLISENKTVAYQERLKQLTDSVTAKSDRNNTAKQGYTPEKLFKMSHAYILKNDAGVEKKTEEEFYIDKDLKKVLKSHKVY
jgi:hypothetical protein